MKDDTGLYSHSAKQTYIFKPPFVHGFATLLRLLADHNALQLGVRDGGAKGVEERYDLVLQRGLHVPQELLQSLDAKRVRLN